MIVIECTQGTPEWHAARAGRVTASRIADLTARTKSGWSASRMNYMADLIAERLTGTVAEGFSSPAMRHGTETEPEARAAYEFFQDVTVTEVGFVVHPTIERAGCSPDGLVGDIGMVEIKCPNTATHLETLLGGTVPEKYLKQMQWQMRCCGRAWCDFVSYDPRLPARMQLFIQRVARDDAMLAEIETQVIDFLAELDAKVKALAIRFPEKVAA